MLATALILTIVVSYVILPLTFATCNIRLFKGLYVNCNTILSFASHFENDKKIICSCILCRNVSQGKLTIFVRFLTSGTLLQYQVYSKEIKHYLMKFKCSYIFKSLRKVNNLVHLEEGGEI